MQQKLRQSAAKLLEKEDGSTTIERIIEEKNFNE